MGIPAWEEALPPAPVAQADSWMLGMHLPTGNIYLALNNGQRVDFSPDDVAHIAAALAEVCDNEDDRAFVVDSWR